MTLNLKDTLTSGQCFRASCNDGLWTLYAGVDEKACSLEVRQDDLSPVFSNSFWHNYFDLSFDYDGVRDYLSGLDSVLNKACDYAPGITILNQDPWEALCSFVVSQNNNIKRITGIISRMCERFGKRAKGADGELLDFYGFPCADTLAGATETDLKSCGLGFRAGYILNTASAVCSGELDFEALKTSPLDRAVKMLTRIKGIGSKVASCALLFGFHRLNAFPVDTWIKKVMALYYPGKDASFFGEYAGIAQQYLFYYIRENAR